MNMKKYTAETMVEVMKKVRADYGDDAIILSSNVVHSKGIFGLFRKKSVEVVVGHDRPQQQQQAESVVYEPKPNRPLPERTDPSTEELKKEMQEMKRLLKSMHIPTDHARYPDEMQALLLHLQKQDLSETLITELADAIFNEMKVQKSDFKLEEQRLLAKKRLVEKFGHLPFGGISFTKKYINVLGPTGVGKTTTIAKIAAQALLTGKKKVGFITTDTYRIAAIEQLRTYANLLQAPVEIVYSAEDFEKAIAKFADLDLVFIDTAGRNYKEVKFVEDLTKLIDFSLDMESFLVLSTTSKEEDMQVIIEQFKSFSIEKLIFTKVDETNSVGPIFNLMQDYSVGTAYYTDGQEVPEDLTDATLDKLIYLLLEDTRYA